MALLQVESGDSKGKKLRLPQRTVVVGRGESADVRIPSAEISREHCRVTPDGEELLVEDLGSSNGTFVNGRPITGEVRMVAGDRVTFGPVTLRLMGIRKPKENGDKPENLDDSKMIDVAAAAKAGKVSDDDVSSWLSETVDEPPKKEGDTTIIKSSTMKAIQPKKPERHFDSVAEEAQDIIRRHFESIDQSPA